MKRTVADDCGVLSVVSSSCYEVHISNVEFQLGHAKSTAPCRLQCKQDLQLHCSI
jgi:hypothetical protein